MTKLEDRLSNEQLFATAHGYEAADYQMAYDIELSASRDLLQAVAPDTQQRLRAEVQQVGRSVLFIAPGVPQVMFNRAQLCAPSGELDLGEIDEILRRFSEVGVDHYLLQVDARVSADHARQVFAARGLKPYRRPWVKLVRYGEPPAEASCDLQISPALSDDAELVASLLCEGFGFPAEAKLFYGAVVGRAGWSAYLARDGVEPAGVGIAFISEGVCYLAGGVTLPRFRRRSVQRVLMRRRIVDAIAAGAHTIVTETGLPLPTEENPSYRNMINMGFRSVGTRHNFGPEGTKW